MLLNSLHVELLSLILRLLPGITVFIVLVFVSIMVLSSVFIGDGSGAG